MSTPADPGEPPAKPPRSALRMRDLVLALGALLLVVLATGGLTRSCSFAPGGPTVDQNGLPVIDAAAELRALAPGVPFPLRIPAALPGWRANATGVDRLAGGARVVRAGWVTPGGTYLRLGQSDASEEALVASVQGQQPLAGQGTVEAGGQQWVVYGRRPDEPVWITGTSGPSPVRLMITGSGTDLEFRTLAAAALSGTPAK